MTALVWDEFGSRTFEYGVDRGVLYPPDASGVAWNGLISVSESANIDSSPVYYEGSKINELTEPGSFSGTMTAITYPEEFLELEGLVKFRNGVYLGNQKPKVFGLCYRTRVGNDFDSEAGYKLHILYNVTAIPADQEYSTVSDNTEPTEFEWDITAIPEYLDGYYPTSHIIINSLDINPVLLEGLEERLYGTESTEPELVPFRDMLDYINSIYPITIVNNGNGTWTAITQNDNDVVMLTPDIFEISNVDATYSNADTYSVSSTE